MFAHHLPASLPDVAAVRELFANLGYQPQTHTSYSGRTLDWSDRDTAELHGRAFELLAATDDMFFQILLLAPHTLTEGLSKQLTQQLYRSLEQTAREGVLVLPNGDWSSFELRLLKDLRPAEERRGTLPEFLSFTLDLRAPQPHHLRALELLDVRAVDALDVPDRAVQAFRRAKHEQFFRAVNMLSTYYLEQRIATDQAEGIGRAWQDLLQAMPVLRGALHGNTGDPQALLAALGWQVAAPASTGGLARLEAGGTAVALLALLPPGHPLDQEVSPTSYPQLELLAALEQEKRQGGLLWGVLTNGRTWRLYSRLAASLSGAFYEVDLADLLDFGSDEELRFFAGFFGAQGLAGGFVRHAMFSAQTLANKVGDDLKTVVFAEVFEQLAQGIADDLKRQGRYDHSPEQREHIRRATLILLYRILFLLYAESMRLLPTFFRNYYPHSLTRLLSEIALQPFVGSALRKPLGPTAFWAWDWLNELFRMVSQGDSQRGVPRYNGGLFSDGGNDPTPYREPFRLLAGVQIGALYLANALDRLGRDREARGGTSADAARRLIDYAALDVRRLGSIYEGLLEYQLVEDGDALKLRHTRQERKASGSYYTPDYIVAYIVEQTVGPLLAEREHQFAALMPQLQAARAGLERAQRRGEGERTSIATAKANIDAAAEHLAALEHEASETLLDLKILDPAMGSGHFLVAAVDFVTDRLISILDRHKDGNPILARLAQIRSQIRESLREQGVDALISDEQLNNVNLLRRLVMKRCVYGVDLNDMAVELARLSLWLNSFTIGAPLSFLDHHLRWGNSLIGARVQQVQQAMEGETMGAATQLDMFSGVSAFKEMLDLAGFIEELVELADANAQQVEQSAALYAAYEQSVVPVKRLLDLWVSRSFGSKEAHELISLYSGKPEEIQKLKAALSGGPPLEHRPWQGAIERAGTLFAQHRFFHWDLEFPEVFLNLRQRAWKSEEQAGFDAVVGNPPYFNVDVILGKQSPIAGFLKADYKDIWMSKSDIFYYFLGKGSIITRHDGYMSFITSRYFLEAKYAENLRNHILNHWNINSIIDFGNFAVFKDAGIKTSIITLQRKKNNNKEDNIVMFLALEKDIKLSQVEKILLDHYPRRFSETYMSSFYQGNWNLLAKKDTNIIYSIDRLSLNLGDLAFIGKGMETGRNESFEISKDDILKYNISNKHLRKLIKNQDIKPYEIVYRNLYILYPEDLQETDLISGVGEFLSLKRSELELRAAYIRGNCDWYKFTWPLHKEKYHLPKIIVPYIAPENRFALDKNAEYLGLTDICVIFPKESTEIRLEYIISVLNSKVMNFRYKMIAKPKDYRYEYFENSLSKIPIPRIDFTTPPAQRAALVEQARGLYAAGLAAGGGAAADWRAWREHWAALWAWAGDLGLEARGLESEARGLDSGDSGVAQLPSPKPQTSEESTQASNLKSLASQELASSPKPQASSDALHDLLALLAEQMIALHKQKQADAAVFTGWLEAETGSRIDGWKLKTAVQSFWEEPWEAIERALQQNRGAFVQSAGLRGKNADAALEPLVRATRQRWSDARAALAPTLAAIRATDRLIDLLVYRLYGLTDEEIDLVEGQ